MLQRGLSKPNCKVFQANYIQLFNISIVHTVLEYYAIIQIFSYTSILLDIFLHVTEHIKAVFLKQANM